MRGNSANQPPRPREDQRSAAIIQHAVVLMNVAGAGEALRYLRQFGIAQPIIERVLGGGPKRLC